MVATSYYTKLLFRVERACVILTSGGAEKLADDGIEELLERVRGECISVDIDTSRQTFGVEVSGCPQPTTLSPALGVHYHLGSRRGHGVRLFGLHRDQSNPITIHNAGLDRARNRRSKCVKASPSVSKRRKSGAQDTPDCSGLALRRDHVQFLCSVSNDYLYIFRLSLSEGV